MILRSVIVPLVAVAVVAGTACNSSGAPPASSGQSGESAQPSGPPRVTGAEAKQLIADGALLIDVRTAGEFADGHIEGARNIPVDRVRAEMGALPKDKPIIVYCAVGARSASAAATLHATGFNVKNLGAMANWSR